MQKVLAIDMGATSIRGIVGSVRDDRIEMQEVMRFSHRIVEKDGQSFWDWEGLMREIVQVILEHPDVASIGVDTWGVDFGLLDEEDELIQPPHSYRDPRFEQGFQKVLAQMDGYEIFRKTGNQLLPINTLFQLKTMQLFETNVTDKARTLLLTPDLVNFFLCGAKRAERTIASTTQMVDLADERWNTELVQSLGLPAEILPELVDSKITIGTTKNSKIKALRQTDIPIVAVASHDTASAVYITKAYDDPETLFLSSGTWSLMGCFSEPPVLTGEAYRNGLTNETGYGGRNMVFKNITGLYLIEKLRQAFQAEGVACDFDAIADIVAQTPETDIRINVDDPVLGQESDHFFDDLDHHLRATGQRVPEKKTDYFRIIYGSLVKAYAKLRRDLETVTGRSFKEIHVIGGGSRSRLFNQMIADGLGLRVLAGPSEATALGNVLAQWEAQSEAEEISHLREMALRSVEMEVFEPQI